MKFIRAAFVAAAVATASASATAEEQDKSFLPGTFSANVAVTTDYRFRGISQTQLIPAIQGGFDWESPSFGPFKVFVGTWLSNVDFQDGDEAQVEIDIYGGLKGDIGKFSWQFMVIYYHYPAATAALNYDFIEFTPSVGYDFGFASVTVGTAFSPNYFGNSGFSAYIFGDISVPLPIEQIARFKPTLFAHIGYQLINRNANFGTPDYVNWAIGVSIEVHGFELSLKYVDTSLSRARCFGGTNLCGATAVFTVSKSF